MRRTSRQVVERLIDRNPLRPHTVPLNGLLYCYGGMPAEALCAACTTPASIERRHISAFPGRSTVEDQTLPTGLGTLFAGSGGQV